MKTYTVVITETLEHEVEVIATNRQEAQRIAEQQWYCQDNILDPDKYMGAKFSVKPPERNRADDR